VSKARTWTRIRSRQKHTLETTMHLIDRFDLCPSMRPAVRQSTDLAASV
jgi:hypothetical protein